MADAGRITRRALLAGTAGAAVVLGGGGAAADYEIDQHPSWRARIFGCGSTPALPQVGSFKVMSGLLPSKAMGRQMPYSLSFPARQPSFGNSNDERFPLIVALPGEGGSAISVPDQLGLPNYADAAGLDAMIVSPGNVQSSYYHPRRNGTDMLSFVLDELVPHVEREHSVGGSRAKRAVYGYSMGGYGALLIAQQRPDSACAVAAASPAVFPSYQNAITGHPDTFDSASDWEQWGLWDHLDTMGQVPVRVDCGNADPFEKTARELIDRIPGAIGHIGSGCHDIAFWRTAAPADVAFLKKHLSS